MTRRSLSALAGSLLVAAALSTSCGGTSDTSATDPDPVDELAQHDGEYCPAKLPQAPEATGGIGTNTPAKSAPTLPKPEEAWLCRYFAGEEDWALDGEPVQLDAAQLTAFSTAITLLKPAELNRMCTADLGPRYLVSYSTGSDLTGVVVDDFGCRDVRLTDEPFTTVPGESTTPGIVPGVLAGPRELLEKLPVLK